MHRSKGASRILSVLLPLGVCDSVRAATLRVFSARVSGSKGGGLAQLGEHYVRNVGVAGSTPVPSTKSSSLQP